MHRLVIACIFLVGSLLSSGCSTKDTDAQADGTVRITFWHSFVSSTIPALEELIDKFEAEHPGIRIDAQYVPSGDALVQKLITSIQSGNAPDVSWIHFDFLEDLVRADAIFKMDTFVNGPNGLSDEDMKAIYPGLLKLASWQGTLFSMPMEATNLALLYNKDHFREAGLDPNRPPQTWQELKTYADRLKVDRNGDGRYERIGFMVPVSPASSHLGHWMVWQWMPFLWQAGGEVITPEQTEVLFGGEAGLQALTLWKDMYDAQNLRTFTTTEAITGFAAKQASMVIDGPWNLSRYAQVMQGSAWGVAPLPAGPVKQATQIGGEYLAIFKQSEHPDAAWTFVKWIAQPEVQAFWSMKSNYLPIRSDVVEVEEYRRHLEQNPHLKAFVESLQYGQAQRSIDFYTLEIQRELAEAIEQATVGGADPRKVLQDAVAQSNRMLATVERDSLLATK